MTDFQRVETDEGEYWRAHVLHDDGATTDLIANCYIADDFDECERFAWYGAWSAEGWYLCLGPVGLDSVLPYTVGVTEKHAIDWVMNRRLPPSMLDEKDKAPSPLEQLQVLVRALENGDYETVFKGPRK
jgi:hypothetical protein